MQESEVRQMRVNKWGGSLGIRFPADFAELLKLKEKSLVEIHAEGEQLIIVKVKEKPKKHSIKELFEMYPSEYIEEEELDWGKPVGELVFVR